MRAGRVLRSTDVQQELEHPHSHLLAPVRVGPAGTGSRAGRA